MAAAGALLVEAVTVGMRVPRLWRLGGLPRPASVDYATIDAGLDPLDPRFIKHVLGDVIAGNAAGSDQPRASRAHRSRSALADFEDLPRTTLKHAFTNDDFGDAQRISSVPYTAKTNTAGADLEQGEPSCAPAVGSAWYRYAPVEDISLSANTFGTGYPASLGVYEGTGLSDLVSLSCDTDARGNAEGTVAARGGITYFFQITGNGGSLVFNLDLTGMTTLASVDSAGQPGRGVAFSVLPAISADGRFVVFSSSAPSLDPARAREPNKTLCPVSPLAGCDFGVYVRDRGTHSTSRIDLDLRGEPSNGFATGISANGRFVAFGSKGSTLVEGDTNVCNASDVAGAPGSCADVFVRDRLTDRTTRVDVTSSGEQANGYSLAGSISGDGRYVVFSSAASNLVAGDTNGVWDVFVHDRLTRMTVRVNVSSSGDQARADAGDSAKAPGIAVESGSTHLSISANGRYVAFRSTASNLVDGDTNHATDVFVRDLVAGTTTRVSVNSKGVQANKGAGFVVYGTTLTVSDDGRFVVFNSAATNLADDNGDGVFDDDQNNAEDVFVRDIVLGTTSRVSISLAEQEAKPGGVAGTGTGSKCELCALLIDESFTQDSGYLHDPYYFGYSMTPSGRYVVFASDAPELVPGDDDVPGFADVFVRDTTFGTTTRVSISSLGDGGDLPSNYPTISPDGRFVAFQSLARNLCDGTPLPRCPDADQTQTQAEGIFVHERPGRGGLSRFY